MITKKQLEILNVFRKNIFSELTFKAMKRLLKETSNSKMQKALHDFGIEGIIRVKKVGKSSIYYLNLENNKIYSYLWLLSLEFPPKKMPFEVLYKIQNAVLKATEFFSLVVFGSYADESAKKDSDIDIAVVVEEKRTKRMVVPYIETVKRREIIPIEYNVFTRKEFLKMLAVEEENVGKQIARNHFVFYNPISFYNMIAKSKK